MSHRYVAVQWNPRKLAYDAFIAVGSYGYLLLFRRLAHHHLRGPAALSEPVLEMRALGSLALVLLTLVLCIGPAARLDRRFAPLLYNRRHLGVLVCFIAVLHARAVLGFYYAFSDVTPAVGLLTLDATITRASLPFPLFGAGALAVLVLMAATSHDFWQRTLHPRVWKWLHMMVYPAYALVVAHVAFGELQLSRDAGLEVALAASVLAVGCLHLLAARRSAAVDGRKARRIERGGTMLLDGGEITALPEDRAVTLVVPDGERLALVRRAGAVSAVRAVCAHQGGPLDEGRVLDGCLTCPWHGWQYRPEDGRSPPPFTEELPTCRVRLEEGRVLVDPQPVAAAAGGGPTTPGDPR